MKEQFLKDAKITHPIIGAPMYPCSNPELVAAVSEAGGIGVVQPLSLVFVHKYEFRKGLQYIKSLTSKPIGLNVIVEKSSKTYEDKMKAWVNIALEEGIRFFITSLGNPSWVVEAAKSVGGVVYHDATERKWAMKALETGVKGLICVNNRAGGHAGPLSEDTLIAELQDLNVPLICAGGVASREDFEKALNLGYAGVQMGTRFIVSSECTAHEDYKKAILNATEKDIVLTEKISGVPVSIIKTPYIEKIGTKANPVARYMLQHPKLKHYMRLFYTLQASWKLKEAALKGSQYEDYWQAGKSVEGCDDILSAKKIIEGLISHEARGDAQAKENH
jgi:nitronate monooxygenase